MVQQGTIATMGGYRRAVNNDNKVSESERILQKTITQHESAVKNLNEKERFWITVIQIS